MPLQEQDFLSLLSYMLLSPIAEDQSFEAEAACLGSAMNIECVPGQVCSGLGKGDMTAPSAQGDRLLVAKDFTEPMERRT